MNSTEYRYGSPSLEEWGGLWKCTEADSRVGDLEFHEAYQSLDQFISRYGKVGFSTDCDFYVLGDSYGDRTQDIEIVNPHALTVEFLGNLERWIRESHPSWRIVVPTFIAPKAVIVVYKDVLRFTKEHEADLVRGLAEVREKMFSLDEYRHLRDGK